MTNSLNEEFINSIIKQTLKFHPAESAMSADELMLLAAGMKGLRVVLLAKMERIYLEAMRTKPDDFLPYLGLGKLYKNDFQDEARAAPYIQAAKERITPDIPQYAEYISELSCLQKK